VDDRDARALVGRIEERETALDTLRTELAAALVELYGEGLARMLPHVGDPAALAGDEVVSHLLMVHGLHPVPVERRVREALDSVRPYLDSHGGGVELLSLDDGVARLKLEGSCNGCPSSRVTLSSAIEDAIQTAAPDVARVEADGLLQIETVGAPAPKRTWARAGELPDLGGGETLVRDVEGEALLFCRLDRRTYAYRSGCPCCGASLGDAGLDGAELRCGGCGHVFDVRRAGRCVDAPQWHLDPVPLLVDHDGAVKVAVA